jgi:hypothetical protein
MYKVIYTSLVPFTPPSMHIIEKKSITDNDL